MIVGANPLGKTERPKGYQARGAPLECGGWWLEYEFDILEIQFGSQMGAQLCMRECVYRAGGGTPWSAVGGGWKLKFEILEI